MKTVGALLWGDGDPRHDVGLLSSMHRGGRMDLAGFVTRQYRLDDINDGYRDLLAGRSVRGIIRYTDADRTD